MKNLITFSLLISLFLLTSCEGEIIEPTHDEGINFIEFQNAVDQSIPNSSFDILDAQYSEMSLPWEIDSMYNVLQLETNLDENLIDGIYFYFNDEYWERFPARLQDNMINESDKYGIWIESQCTYLPVSGSIRKNDHCRTITFDVRFKSIHDVNIGCEFDAFFLSGKFSF